MKTRKFLKYLGLGLGGTTLTTGNLLAADPTEAQRVFCSTVGFGGAMDSSVSTPCKVVPNTNELQSWVSFVKGGALLMTVYFGYQGSGISDKHPFNIKTLAFAGAFAALALQYTTIMKMISGFFNV
jgi:hypothetical protein